jgi:hypothetical protein
MILIVFGSSFGKKLAGTRVPPILFYRALLFKQNFTRHVNVSIGDTTRLIGGDHVCASTHFVLTLGRIASRQSVCVKYNIAAKKISTSGRGARVSFVAANKRHAILRQLN